MPISGWSSDVFSSDLKESAEPLLLLSQPSQAVFVNNHRSIDDEAEIECAQAHEVGGGSCRQHARQGHQHRNRNHGGGNQRRAEIAEQEEQDDNHQQGALGEVLLHRSEETTSELQSLMRTPSAVFCLNKNKTQRTQII